jgi:hypothetical protein
MHLVLHISSSSPAGVRRGTIRRDSDTDGDALPFHGVFELIAALDRLLDADEVGTDGTRGAP